MRHIITKRRLALPLIALLAVAGCEEEDEAATEVPNVSVMALSTSQWPPAIEDDQAAFVADSEIDPFAENNMIVLDMSGSMSESACAGENDNRADAAKAALLSWITANPGDNVGLVSFSSKGIEMDMALDNGREHAKKVVERIQSLRADHGTPLYTAMQMGKDELERQAVRQNGLGTYRLIVITDGQASNGESPLPVLDEIASNPANMIEVHTIGFCISGNHSLKDPGRVFYVDANSPEDLRSGLDATKGEAASFDPSAENFEEPS